MIALSPGHWQFVRFCVVGVVNTALNYAVYWLLLEGAGLQYLVAGALGFLSGAVSGFFLNRKWTFAARVATGSGLARYLAVQLVCLGAHVLTQWTAAQAFGVPDRYSQFFGIVVTTFLNFFLSRALVFGKGARREGIA